MSRIAAQALGLFTMSIASAGCGPRLPADLESLMEMMNSNNQTISVNASNKVANEFGSKGLLMVLSQGKPTAKAKAAQRLRHFPGEEVERALVEAVQKEPDSFIRSQALCSLAIVGTALALDAAEKARQDSDERVTNCAKEAIESIRARLIGAPSK